MILSANALNPPSSSRRFFPWEEPACLLCGQYHSSLLIEGPDSRPDGSGLWFAIVQCQGCGLCFTSPRPTPDAIAQFYPESYEPHRAPARANAAPRNAVRRPRWSGDLRKSLPWHGQGRLLDFGCGGGSFLARMASQGWTVTGLDASTRAVRRVEERLGLRVLRGTLPHPELRPHSFDVITMWQSLEHVHQPLETLRAAHRLLAPGGKLIVAVPNIDSLPFCWFRRGWIGLDLPRHLTHFSPWTLRAMLQRAGFEVGAVRMLRHSEWLRASAARLREKAPTPVWNRWLRAKPLARLAACYASLTQQTDCMLALATKDPHIQAASLPA